MCSDAIQTIRYGAADYRGMENHPTFSRWRVPGCALVSSVGNDPAITHKWTTRLAVRQRLIYGSILIGNRDAPLTVSPQARHPSCKPRMAAGPVQDIWGGASGRRLASSYGPIRE